MKNSWRKTGFSYFDTPTAVAPAVEPTAHSNETDNMINDMVAMIDAVKEMEGGA